MNMGFTLFIVYLIVATLAYSSEFINSWIHPVEYSPSPEMIYLLIRDSFVPSDSEGGIDSLVYKFHDLFQNEHLHVDVLTNDGKTIIGYANYGNQLLAIEKLARMQEEVLKITYRGKSFPGNHIAEYERVQNRLIKLPKNDDYDPV